MRGRRRQTRSEKTNNNISMNKDDERVLCVPTADVVEIIGDKTGLIYQPEMHQKLADLVAQACATKKFVRRGDCETDESLLQIIPYVIYWMRDTGEFLSFSRGSKIHENRLANKVSIGIGGHMNEEDGGNYFEALLREQREEVSIPPEILDIQFRVSGYLRLIKTPVDRVHFGVVHVVHVPRELRDKFLVPPDETENLKELQWRNVVDLCALYTAGLLEPWTVEVLSSVFTILPRQP
jgi:predicted NUDIX family phosphoesterase